MLPTLPPAPEHEQPITASDAAPILGLCATSTFNRVRRRLERYVVVIDGAAPQLHPVPPFDSTADYRRFAREHVLVVPEWGGRSVYGGDWSYLRSRCESWARLTRSGSDEP